MSELIEHSVEIRPGVNANTVGPIADISEMYPNWQQGSEATNTAQETVELDGISVTTFNSSLSFEVVDDKLAILGNTKTSTCAVAKECGSCALAGSELNVIEMSARNCAQANTAMAFGAVSDSPKGRFMLFPVVRKGHEAEDKRAFVVDNGDYTTEANGTEVMQNRLRNAPAVVFTESWIREQGLTEISAGINGADGSFGVAVTEVDGEKLIIPFCSMRTNMGDREEEDQILRQALTAYFDSKEFSGEKRQEVLSQMNISIVLSASASLANFAHKIQVPADDHPYAQTLRLKYPELTEQAGGRITSAIVLNDQYPGALERESIFPQFEAEMGIRSTPITPDSCPGDGQTCHVDYRSETEYALRKQLTDMGIAESRISYAADFALDPSSPENNMASNRREQNNGVEPKMTNRTINGAVVRLA